MTTSPTNGPPAPVQVALFFGSDLLELRQVRPERADWPVERLMGGTGPLVRWEAGLPRVFVPAGAQAFVLRDGADPTPVQGPVDVNAGEQVHLRAGRVAVRIAPGRAVRRLPFRPGALVERRVLAAFAGVALVLFPMVLLVATARPGEASQSVDSRLVDGVVLILDETPPPPVAREEPATSSRGSAGQLHRTTPGARRARAHRIARNPREEAMAAGLLGDLGDVAALTGGPSGLDTALRGLQGPALALGGPGGLLSGGRGGPGLGGGASGLEVGDLGFGGPRGKRRGNPAPAQVGEHRESEPVAQAQPPLILGDLFAGEWIDRVVKQNLPALRYCYERGLQLRPTLSGKVSTRFVIASDGSVSSSETAASSLNAPDVESCLAERFRRMHFGAGTRKGIVIVRYPLVFRPAGR